MPREAQLTCMRPYSPWQNTESERTDPIISQEWRHGRAWGSKVERMDAPDWPIIEIAARYH